MAMLLVRIVRSLPLVVVLLVIAVAVYFFIRCHSTPNRAKEVLIALFIRIGIGLSGFFALACGYSLFEHNDLALDFMLGFLAVSLLVFAIARICRAVFLHRNPKYRTKAAKTTKEKRQGSRENK